MSIWHLLSKQKSFSFFERFDYFLQKRQGKEIESCFDLVIRKSARRATSRQQEIEMACLSIKYYCGTLKWWMRRNQRWWSAQNWTLSSVTMSDTNWSLKERCTTDDMSTVSVRVSVILLFLTRYSKEFKKKSCSSKTFGFFSNKLSLDLGISSCFSSLISSFQRATAR